MTDREKIIDAIEKAKKQSEEYAQDRIIVPFKEADMILAILKEQEAVKRTYRTGINGFSIIWTCGACGSDLHPNNAKAKYCSNCGKPVKWDD